MAVVTELEDEKIERRKDNDQADEYKANAEAQIGGLSKEVRELETQCESLIGKLERANEGSENS